MTTEPTPLPAPLQRRVDALGLPRIASSLREASGAALWLEPRERRLHLLAPEGHALLTAFGGTISVAGDGARHLVGPRSAANAAALRRALPNLAPRPLGTATCAGFGDRLGSATPGHVRALERVRAEHGSGEILPIFAQQSIREMTRTGRSPQRVLDDATWGAFETGWRGPVGADADHLKTPEDVERCAAAGYSFFTVDPGDRVDDGAARASGRELEAKLDALPWEALESDRSELLRRYDGRRLDLEGLELAFDPEAVARAAAKYGAALAHAAAMHRHLQGLGVPFELEVSVDETGTPTTLAEHAFLALELRRLGVRPVSLAPRFVGRFEKGVDFRGDLAELERTLDGHARIARALGPYKLSLHSGSDKFSVYPLVAEATGGTVHLKTAGTSYLEALRVAAALAPALFREILERSHARFAQDRASYHISADPAAVPAADAPSDDALPALLDDDDARQLLHVTYGSVLDSHGERLRAFLAQNRDAYAAGLERHFVRHLEPFARRAASPRPGGPAPEGADR